MSALNPKVILAAIIAAGLIFGWGHHKGWAERDAEMQAAIATANQESREREQKLSEELNQTSIQLGAANDAITQKQSSLDRAIRAGRVRLPAAGCVPASASATTPSGDQQAGSQPNRQADSDSSADDTERQTLAAIAAIVAQGDRNTAQLNACIDAYEAVRQQINGQGR